MLDIIIVNYNTGNLLRECVQSLAAAQAATAVIQNLIVVDNASSDDSLAQIDSLYPGVLLVNGALTANNVQAYIVLKMPAVNGAEDALDMADEVSAQMPRDELEVATQVLGQIFRKYLLELQSAEGRTPFSPLP